jgi:hypothetical protein
VRLEEGGKEVTARGADPDTLVASAKAYPNIAKAKPQVPIMTSTVSVNCGQPVVTTMSGAGEDGKGHQRDRQADLQRLPHRRMNDASAMRGRYRGRQRCRRRQLAPDRDQEHEEMRDPGVDAKFGQRLRR